MSYTSVMEMKPEIITVDELKISTILVFLVGAVLLCAIVYVMIRTESRRVKVLGSFCAGAVVGVSALLIQSSISTFQQGEFRYADWVYTQYIPYVDSIDYEYEWLVYGFVMEDGQAYATYESGKRYPLNPQDNREMQLYNNRLSIELDYPFEYVIREKRIGGELLPFLYKNDKVE